MTRTEIQDELYDLQAGDPLLPPDSNSSSALKVIPVHDYMDSEVESDRHP